MKVVTIMSVKSISMAIGLVLTIGGGLGAADAFAGPRLDALVNAVKKSKAAKPAPAPAEAAAHVEDVGDGALRGGDAPGIDGRSPRISRRSGCPTPIDIHVFKNSGPTSGFGGDFGGTIGMNEAPYNATAENLEFTDTLYWKLPDNRCCEVQGTVTIVLQNLGGIMNNDAAYVIQGGQGVPGFGEGKGILWTNSSVTGQVKTLTYTLTQAMIDRRQLSVYVQDDTAVVSISVDIVGCCVTPRR